MKNKYNNFVEQQSVNHSNQIIMGQPLQNMSPQNFETNYPEMQNMQGQNYQQNYQLPVRQPIYQPQPMNQPMNQPITNIKNCENSLLLTCPMCKKTGPTLVNHEAGNTTYIWTIALICCCWPLSCLPCICQSCQDKVHYCPNCGNNIMRIHGECCDCCS